MTTPLTKSDRDALRDAEDAIIQAQTRLRELAYFTQSKHAKEIINASAVQIGEVFGRLRDHINAMHKLQ